MEVYTIEIKVGYFMKMGLAGLLGFQSCGVPQQQNWLMLTSEGFSYDADVAILEVYYSCSMAW